MRIRIGYDLTYRHLQDTPIIAMLEVHSSRRNDLERLDFRVWTCGYLQTAFSMLSEIDASVSSRRRVTLGFHARRLSMIASSLTLRTALRSTASPYHPASAQGGPHRTLTVIVAVGIVVGCVGMGGHTSFVEPASRDHRRQTTAPPLGSNGEASDCR
jgi:hypothetical protein